MPPINTTVVSGVMTPIVFGKNIAEKNSPQRSSIITGVAKAVDVHPKNLIKLAIPNERTTAKIPCTT